MQVDLDLRNRRQAATAIHCLAQDPDLRAPIAALALPALAAQLEVRKRPWCRSVLLGMRVDSRLMRIPACHSWSRQVCLTGEQLDTVSSLNPTCCRRNSIPRPKL